MTRVLLTGASGFIGSHTLEHFLTNTDWEIICICSWQHKGTPERIEEVLKGSPEWKNRVEVITHDLTSPLTERTIARLGKIDYIVNVASESHVDRSIEEPVPFIQNNVNLMITMLELSRQIQPKTFIQVSTDEVYGVAPEGVDHKEWAPIVPSNPYSASKAAQEAIAIAYWRTYGVPLVVTNTMNNFGEMQDPEKYMAKLIKLIVGGKKVPVHGSEGNIGSRFYLHARNHADAILFILQNLPATPYTEGTDLVPDRYNVVGDIELDNLQVANRIAGVLGEPLNYELVDFHATRPGHDRRYALDGTKLKNLGWIPPLDFTKSLAKYVSWTLKNPTWM